jgi:omega-amidase
LKIAAAQISCSLGDVAENLRKIDNFSARAKAAGADLILFPEIVDTGYSMPVIRERATSWENGAVAELRKIAQKLSLMIVCGLSEREGMSVFNSQVVVDQSGEILAKYRKTHLFASGEIEEHKCFSPGDSFTAFAGNGFHFGLSICYDLRFPELYRSLTVDQNVDAFLISSAWPLPRLEHFRTLAVARAIENQSYVIAANRVGKDDGVSFCGSSMIVDPYGVVIAAASADREELVHAELSSDLVASVRKRIDVFAARRGDLYK